MKNFSSPVKTYGNNVFIPMSRRYPDLPAKILRRDSSISKKIINAWDKNQNAEEVLSIFIKEQKNLSDERYWEIMRSVWIITGSVKNSPIFRKLMASKRKSQYYFSTPEEAKKLRELPEEVTIYRATNDPNDEGLSWTISKKYAEGYQKQYQKEMIIALKVKRSEIFALIDRNNEYEVIVLNPYQ